MNPLSKTLRGIQVQEGLYPGHEQRFLDYMTQVINENFGEITVVKSTDIKPIYTANDGLVSDSVLVEGQTYKIKNTLYTHDPIELTQSSQTLVINLATIGLKNGDKFLLTTTFEDTIDVACTGTSFIEHETAHNGVLTNIRLGTVSNISTPTLTITMTGVGNTLSDISIDKFLGTHEANSVSEFPSSEYELTLNSWTQINSIADFTFTGSAGDSAYGLSDGALVTVLNNDTGIIALSATENDYYDIGFVGNPSIIVDTFSTPKTHSCSIGMALNGGTEVLLTIPAYSSVTNDASTDCIVNGIPQYTIRVKVGSGSQGLVIKQHGTDGFAGFDFTIRKVIPATMVSFTATAIKDDRFGKVILPALGIGQVWTDQTTTMSLVQYDLVHDVLVDSGSDFSGVYADLTGKPDLSLKADLAVVNSRTGNTSTDIDLSDTDIFTSGGGGVLVLTGYPTVNYFNLTNSDTKTIGHIVDLPDFREVKFTNEDGSTTTFSHTGVGGASATDLVSDTATTNAIVGRTDGSDFICYAKNGNVNVRTNIVILS